jgi:hypothetical protein
MEYNQPSLIVKDLNFGEDAKTRIIAGVDKLAQASYTTRLKIWVLHLSKKLQKTL